MNHVLIELQSRPESRMTMAFLFIIQYYVIIIILSFLFFFKEVICVDQF